MTFLLGFMCNDPERVSCALHPVRGALAVGDAAEGWGLGFFQGGEVLLQRHPKPVVGLDLYAQMAQLRTDYIVGQVRGPGVVRKLENTQPYRFRSWVFATIGDVDGYAAANSGVEARLHAKIPDFLARNIRGQADAEHIFHIFLAACTRPASSTIRTSASPTRPPRCAGR